MKSFITSALCIALLLMAGCDGLLPNPEGLATDDIPGAIATGMVTSAARTQNAAATQTAALTLPAPPTPVAVDLRGLTQSRAPAGYPQLGFSNAPVSVTVYAAFDDPASAQFFTSTAWETLVSRARNGEILITYVPIVIGGFQNAGQLAALPSENAAVAAVCAGEQDAFWSYTSALFARASELRTEAFTPEELVGTAQRISLPLEDWIDCRASQRPAAVLGDAESVRAGQSMFTTTPFVMVDNLVALTDAESLDFTIDRAIILLNQSFSEALTDTGITPTFAALSADATLDPESTEMVMVTLEPLMGEGVPPPIAVTLPEGWRSGYDTLILQDIDAIRTIPLAIYSGPVTGGIGSIVLLWGFPNLLVGGATSPDLWADGTRLLRLAVVENSCNIGTDIRREYNVAGLTALGTAFSAVECDELPDTRGWFAGLQQYGTNFIFYAYADPIEAMTNAESELSAILASIEFVLPLETPTPEATTAP